MVSTRRSARRGGNGPLAADGAPSELAPDAPPPPSVRRRQSRDASPPGWPGRAREKASFVISNDDKLKQPVGADKQDRQGRDIVVVEEPDEMDEDSRSLEEPPGWLPDGWIMEVCRDDDSSIYRHYTSPVSGYTFTSKMETIEYLFSGMEERMLESQERIEDNELHGSHTWLPGGWLIEVRAGGKKMDKMYKPQSMLKRLKAEGQTKHKSRRALVLNKELPNDQTSNHSEGGLTPKSDPKGNKFGNEKGTSTHEIGSETTIRRRGRPKKILKQTNESIPDRDRRHNETKHNEVKEEVDIGVEEGMPNGKTKEHTEMLECTTVIQEVENNSSIAERNLSRRKGDESDLVACPGLESQENGRLTKAGEKATCTSVYKFYKRRCSNQMLGSNKG